MLEPYTFAIPTEVVNTGTASIVWRADGLHVQWNERNDGDPAALIRSRR